MSGYSKEREGDEISLVKSLFDEGEAWFLYYVIEPGRVIKECEKSPAIDYAFPAATDYFSIYRGNAIQIARLPNDEVRRPLIAFFTTANALIDALRANNALRGSYLEAEANAQIEGTLQDSWRAVRDSRFDKWSTLAVTIVELDKRVRDLRSKFLAAADSMINRDTSADEIVAAKVTASTAMMIGAGTVAESVDKYCCWCLAAVGAGFVAVIRQLPVFKDVADARNLLWCVLFFITAFILCAAQRWIGAQVKAGAATAEKLQGQIKDLRVFNLEEFNAQMLRVVPWPSRSKVRKLTKQMADGDIAAGAVHMARRTWVQAIIGVMEITALTACICAALK